MTLSLANFSATGTIHMQMRVTSGNYERGNGQENLWASALWTNDGTDGQVGTLEEGDAEITDSITLARFARWDRSGTDKRLIFNAQGAIGGLFNESDDPYRFTIVRETDTGHAIMTVGPLSGEAADRTFTDWRLNDGTLNVTEWNFINAIASGDDVILSVHEGTASYTTGDAVLALEARAGDPTAAFDLRHIPPTQRLALEARAGNPSAAFDLTFIPQDVQELALAARAGNPSASFDLRAIVLQRLALEARAGNPDAAFDLRAIELQRLALEARAGNPTAALDLTFIPQDVQLLALEARAGNPTADADLRFIPQDVQELALAARAGNPSAAFALTFVPQDVQLLALEARAGSPTAAFNLEGDPPIALDTSELVPVAGGTYSAAVRSLGA